MQEASQTSRQRFEWREQFRRRGQLFLLFFSLWMLVIVGRLFQIMVLDRDVYLEKYQAASFRQGILPAMRGRILDRDGTPLAWSTRLFQLSYAVPEDVRLLHQDLQVISRVMNMSIDDLQVLTARHPGKTVTLAHRLDSAQVLAIDRLQNARLEILSSFIRHHAELPQPQREALGETRVFGQVEVGISGWEAYYDQRLRGINGSYQVMVDKHGQWIPETWVPISPPRPGYDVFLPVNPIER